MSSADVAEKPDDAIVALTTFLEAREQAPEVVVHILNQGVIIIVLKSGAQEFARRDACVTNGGIHLTKFLKISPLFETLTFQEKMSMTALP